METLQVMRRLVLDAVQNTAVHPPLDLLDSSLDEIDFWTRGHFHYRPELNEVVRTPERMCVELVTRGFFEGDCDDVSVMLAYLFCSTGYRCRFVAIRYDNNPNFEHVFVEAYDPQLGAWRVFDPTVTLGTQYGEQERMVVPVC